MPKILESLPFYTNSGVPGARVRNSSRKGYALNQLWELHACGLPPHGVGIPRVACSLRDRANQSIKVKSNQMLTWISLGFPGKQRSDRSFPVIIDPGCNHALSASEYHLEHWAKSARFDFLSCEVVTFARESVANTPAQGPGSLKSPPKHLLPNKLHSIWGQWTSGQIKDWLPVIATDLWLACNEPFERDELRHVEPWIRLEVRGIVVRPGDMARPPLLGLQALQDGNLMVQGRPHRMDRLEVDLASSLVNLSYS